MSTAPEDTLMQVAVSEGFWQGDGGLDGLWDGVVQPMLALEGFLGDQYPSQGGSKF